MEERFLTDIGHVIVQVAKPQYVLLWCWAAAVGAGLLKSEDFLLGAARLRVSHDIQYETETFDLLMDEATKVNSLPASVQTSADLKLESDSQGGCPWSMHMPDAKVHSDTCAETSKV